jgi:hypothetical protein
MVNKRTRTTATEEGKRGGEKGRSRKTGGKKEHGTMNGSKQKETTEQKDIREGRRKEERNGGGEGGGRKGKNLE